MSRLPTGRIFWGALLTLLGVFWLLDNLQIMTIAWDQLIETWWPLILVYLGAAGLVRAISQAAKGGRGLLWGSVLVNGFLTLFFFLLLGNLNGWFYVDLGLMWRLILPVGLLLFGGSLLMRGAGRPGARSYVAIMGPAKDRRTTWADLAPIAVMGGVEIDLTGAGLPEQDVLIDCYAVMGGVNLRLPAGVRVVCDATSVMGGVDLFGKGHGGLVSSQQFEAGSGPAVHVRAVTVMGGVKIM